MRLMKTDHAARLTYTENSDRRLMRTRVKICGITRKQDVIAAANAGADALGFVFYEPSPRYVTPDAARELVDAVPPFVAATGLFVNPEASYVREVLSQVPLGDRKSVV